MDGKDWIPLLPSIVTAASVIVALLTYFFYIRRMRVDSILHIATRLEQDRQNRHIVYVLPDDWRNWNPEQTKAADEVCRGFDLLGYFHEEGIIPDSFLKGLYADPVLRCWEKCEKFVLNERDTRGPKDHFSHLEDLVKHCRKFKPKEHKEAVAKTS